MLDLAAMSPSEVQFIRLYVTTLKREYYLLRSVIDLMSPHNLGIKSFIDAANASLKLAELQQDFEEQLRSVQKKNNMRTVLTHTEPTLNELADLFSSSFFKLITTDENAVGQKVVDNNGWFSGKPIEWKKTLINYKEIPKDKISSLPNLLVDFFTAALKFFPFDNGGWLSGQSNLTKKIWPPGPTNWYFDDEDIDEDEDDPNPFGWLFDDDDDD